jgi:hypothetical protein
MDVEVGDVLQHEVQEVVVAEQDLVVLQRHLAAGNSLPRDDFSGGQRYSF